MQTLKQLTDAKTIPCCEIKDSPRYPWRGVLLDESRHFFGRETVKALLDEMARYKFNRFHWHLTDDQGWCIEVPGCSELVEYGAVRKSSPKRPDRGGPRGNDEAIKFAEGVLDYVCKVFPFNVVHIGGDECPKRRWKESRFMCTV